MIHVNFDEKEMDIDTKGSEDEVRLLNEAYMDLQRVLKKLVIERTMFKETLKNFDTVPNSEDKVKSIKQNIDTIQSTINELELMYLALETVDKDDELDEEMLRTVISFGKEYLKDYDNSMVKAMLFTSYKLNLINRI